MAHGDQFIAGVPKRRNDAVYLRRPGICSNNYAHATRWSVGQMKPGLPLRESLLTDDRFVSRNRHRLFIQISHFAGIIHRTMTSLIEYFNDVEGDMCYRINRLSHRQWVRRFFAIISRLGDGVIWAVFAGVLYILQGPAALPAIWQMALTGAAGVLLYKSMKNRLVRERPYINHGSILCGTAPLDRYSFPSGHTLHATSFAIMLSQYEPLLVPIVVPLSVLIAASRVILGLHYPSDVIVGATIGTALATTSLALF